MNFCSAALFVALLALPLPLLADTTYTYTGNSFDTFFGSAYTPSDFVSGSFTLADPLAAGFGGLVHPISLSFSDGVQTTDNGYTFPSLLIVVDSSGNVAIWRVQFETTGSGVITTQRLGGGSTDADYGYLPGHTDSAELFQNPGTWAVTTTATPEPSTLTLAATGLLGCAGAIRRKLRR